MGVIAVMAIYGLKDLASGQSVTDAQRNFISDLRATQNKVINGADGKNVKIATISASLAQYTIDGAAAPISLPSGVSFFTPTNDLRICFFNPQVTNAACYTCTGSFACPVPADGKTVNVSFTNNKTTKNVIIEGFGTVINRIYATN